MFRILRAFAWLRMRTLLNSLERTTSRDTMERFSVALEQIAPILVMIAMIPSAIGFGGMAAYAGLSLAQGSERVFVIGALQFLLFAGTVLAAIGPVILPTAERTNAVRLLLLPIPRGLLYAGQMMSVFTDPWMLLVAAILVALPLGVAAGGAVVGAAMAAAASLLLLIVLSGLGLVATSIVHVVVRNRRRGELVGLLFIVILPIVGILPAMFDPDFQREQRAASRVEQQEPDWWTRAGRSALEAAPPALYVRAVRAAAVENSAAVLRPVLALAVTAAVLHGLAFALFVRVLSSPGVLSSTRSSSSASSSGFRIPWLSPATSAVAINQLRLALRTPRGRSIILSPAVVLAVFSVMMFRSQSGGADFGLLKLGSGVALAAFSSFVSMLALIPFAMNQFAVDRAGLTLTFLSPIATRTLLRGKAIGNALIVAMPVAVSLIAPAVLFPTGGLAVWVSLPLAFFAIYALTAPVAAILSAVFPRSVDLNSVSRGSNAHGAAGFIGTLSFAAAGLPCLGIVLLAVKILERPWLAPLLLLVWIAISTGISAVLFRMATEIFEKRRETLAMVA
jgi:hypothetical protein